MSDKSRRKFIYNASIIALGTPLIASAEKIRSLNPFEDVINQNKQKGKLGIALVGLGNYATGQLAPALQQTEHCYLAGIVTGTPSKVETWKEKYKIPERNIYNYENFDSIKNNPDIDIVYVVLPNFLHAEYTIRAAKAGKHVICEKPMALSVADCDKMIAACKQAGKMLSIGYRLHFDPYHLEITRLAHQAVYGKVKKISAGFAFVAQKGEWRLDKTRSGGGPLMDLGIYCFQAACYTTGLEPIAVTAQSAPISDTEKFNGIEETLDFQLEMPNGIVAACRTSYSENMNYLKIDAEKGSFELRPAFNYNGLKGQTPDGPLQFAPISQQAKQMDDFALAVKNNTPSKVPGEMGRRDLKIIAAIYEAMATGKRVEVNKG